MATVVKNAVVAGGLSAQGSPAREVGHGRRRRVFRNAFPIEAGRQAGPDVRPIAEATDADGHLFRFERIHELPRAATSAAEVANAAHSFGQDDDISVISVTRIPVIEPALA